MLLQNTQEVLEIAGNANFYPSSSPARFHRQLHNFKHADKWGKTFGSTVKSKEFWVQKWSEPQPPHSQIPTHHEENLIPVVDARIW